MALKVSIKLPSVTSSNREVFMSRPIELSFEIPYFTVSGILIRYLKIEDKSNYKAAPFVRYITKNGKYYIRTNYVKPVNN
jgi:AP-1 complex subunit mu